MIAAPPPVRRSLSYRDLQPDTDLLITLHEPDARVADIPEAVVQDIWRGLRFSQAGLITTEGAPVEIWHPGALNTDAGPDFTGARVYIGSCCWMGDVEIHRTSGEWFEHRHDEDPRYDRVALHVTLVPDRHTGRLRRSDGTLIPEIVLYPRLNTSLRSLLHRFYSAPTTDFFCASQWEDVPVSVRTSLIHALGTERLAERKADLAAAFCRAPDLDRLLWVRVLRALGYAKNAEPMEALARAVPLERLRALDDERDVEALLLGAAGLIPGPAALLDADRATADYATDLRDRFERLYALEPVSVLQPTVWRRSRLRASSLPTRRIVQAAALVFRGPFRLDAVDRFADAARTEHPLAALRALLTDPQPGPFWKTHLRLDRTCKLGSAAVGRGHADAVLINAVLPVLLLHAEQTDDHALDASVRALYDAFPAASDTITRRFARRGSPPRNALEAQGLHQLYRTRCTCGRCLECPVGQRVIGATQREVGATA